MITDKNIVLTGCNNGIGLEVLKLFLEGVNRILCVDTGTDNLESLARENKNVFILKKDVSSQEAVDEIFTKAEELFSHIDIFYSNAGFAYYEEINYTDWSRIKRIFDTNVFSPVYSYQKYRRHIGENKGIFVFTVSVIGIVAIPGFALYSSTKFALSGFSRAIRFEKPRNMQLTCIYPVATDTGFFRRANKIDFEKPFPVQSPETVARKAVKGIEKGKNTVNPCLLFNISAPLMKALPFLKSLYLYFENKKFTRFREKLRKIY